MVLHLIGKVVHVDDRSFNASLRQSIQHMVDERPAGNFHQWFRERIREWTHTRAKPCGENHGAARNDFYLW
jgi:hypothetical protein